MNLTALKFYTTVIWLVPEKLGRTVLVKGMLSGLVNVSYAVKIIYNIFYTCAVKTISFYIVYNVHSVLHSNLAVETGDMAKCQESK